MVFKRRDRRGFLRAVWEVIYPRGGWKRAYHYVQHRLQRLPGAPEMIARGIACGVFVSFTPFFGLHFFLAVGLALIVRGSLIASLLGTFFGNPLTYLPIAATSLGTGYAILRIPPKQALEGSIFRKFTNAAADLRDNFLALFTPDRADWTRLLRFWDDIFLPWLIGGIIPGVIFAVLSYYVSVPLIRAYQNRRKGALKAKLVELRDRVKPKDEPQE